jgi:hypothetical protein
METRQDYFWSAVNALRIFAARELAFAEFEAVAKLIEAHFDSDPFQPHHLTAAKNYLLESGELSAEAASTRGGRAVPLLLSTSPPTRASLEEAAGRKRLLVGRYYGWTQGTSTTGEGLSGVAGEMAAHGAISRAGVGTSLASTFRDRPRVSRLLGVDVPTGPLDNALMLQPLTLELLPRPPYGVLVPIEVKNIREWVYPHTKELYQLLDKSVELQRRLSDRPMIPLLICRKAHVTTTFMAKALGFFVVDAHRHFFPVHSRIDVSRFDELRKELGLSDLTQDLSQTGRVEAGLRALQRKYDVEEAAARWHALSSIDAFADLIGELRAADGSARDQLMLELRSLTESLGYRQGW